MSSRHGAVLLSLALCACGGGDRNPSGADGGPQSSQVYGDEVQGQYHLGPVDFAETEWHNACAPGGGYRQDLRDITGLSGEFLAGVSNQMAQGGGVCDSCIRITTATDRTVVARVVTYGVSNDPGDLDVSPSVYDLLDTDEFPRSMTWQFAKCPDTGSLRYEFKTGSNVFWTSFWVRNQRIPVTDVEVRSANHGDFISLRRDSDGSVTDDSGFGEGEFTLRITAMDGQVIEDTFSSFEAGQVLVSSQQFQ